MLQSVIDAEVEAFLTMHADRTDKRGRRLVVKKGSLPQREILTGAGSIPVTQGRVRDKDPDPSKRVTFSSSVLASCLRVETSGKLTRTGCIKIRSVLIRSVMPIR